MRRRAPPRGYYEEDEQFNDERKRDQYPRLPRPYHELVEEEEDVDYRRRPSIPPVEELDRLQIREEPPRDFMRGSFVPQRKRDRDAVVMRRSPEDVDEIPWETEREGGCLRPSRERRGYAPRDVDEERMVDIRDWGRRGDRRRLSERDPVEDDVVVRRRRGPSFREQSSEEDIRLRERLDDEGGEMYVRRSGPRRKPKRHEEEIDEFPVDESERERLRFRRSLEGARFDRREELDEAGIDDSGREWSRRRKSPGEPKVEEDLILDERERERPRDRKYREKPRRKEEMIIKLKDRASPEMDEEMDEGEIQFRERRRHRRRSPPDPRLSREPPGKGPAEREDDDSDEDTRVRSRMRSRPRHRAVEDDEELAFRHKERDQHRVSLGDDELMFRKTKRRTPSPERSPPLRSIHAPPIHQDVIMHPRHIDHGRNHPTRLGMVTNGYQGMIESRKHPVQMSHPPDLALMRLMPASGEFPKRHIFA